MPISPHGNKRLGKFDHNPEQSGSILIDAVVGLIILTVLGIAILVLIGQVYAGLSTLENGLKVETTEIKKNNAALW